ncbi:hypothetical protein CGCFRS4_v016044 [Colletotrichum fructicola]|nr:hypothetical protein CGCFRS4_v016044 [Colletotrichum fructicola]
MPCIARRSGELCAQFLQGSGATSIGTQQFLCCDGVEPGSARRLRRVR